MAESSSTTFAGNAGHEDATTTGSPRDGDADTPPQEGRPDDRVNGWTTRSWLLAGVASALAVLVVLSLLGAWIFARGGQAANRLVNRDTPALIAAVRLEAALLNQETGIRGYGLTGRPEFCSPIPTAWHRSSRNSVFSGRWERRPVNARI